MKSARLLLLLPVCLFAGACGLLPDAYSGCDKAQPYQAAQDLPPLRVPADAVLPDTRNAMHVPAVNVPMVPVAPGTCLDHPPTYGGAPKAG